MAQFSAGLTDALDSIQRRKYEEAQINRIQDEIAAYARAENQQDQQKERRRKAEAGAAEFYASQQGTPQVAPPPPGAMTPQTAVPPGQASQPMVRPPPAAAFGPQGGPPPSLQPPPPSAQLPQSVGGQQPPQPQGWRPSASAPLNLGGAPPMPAGGPGGAPMPSVEPPPVPTPPPQVLDSLPSVFQWAVKQGKSYEEAYDIAAAAAPIQDSHNKAILAEMKQEVDIQRELAAHEKMLRERALAEAGPKPPAPTMVEKESRRLDELKAKGQTNTEEYKALKAHLARVDAPARTSVNVGGDFGGKSGDLLGALAERGVSLPVGLRSKQQMQATVQGILRRNPDLSVDQIADKIKSGQIDFGAEKKETTVAAGRAGQIQVAANEVDEFAKLVEASSKKLPRSQFVPFNKLQQMGQQSISSPELREYRQNMMALANAYDALAARGGTDAQKREENRRNFDTADGPEALAATLKAMKDEAAGASRAAVKAMKPIKADGGEKPSGPKKGDVEDGYKFKGGDPSKRENWEKI